jgi:L-fuculose-phosphate aldolase
MATKRNAVPTSHAPKRSRLALASEIIETCKRMNALGLNQGTVGNISARLDTGHFLVTPSGIPYDVMRPEDVPVLDWNGHWFGPRRPSTEWRFHRDILKARAEADVVLHTHSMHSTALACTRQGIPAFHYMVAVAGGDDIRCADYATFSTQELSDNALAALKGRRACLLANHGLICLGATLPKALGLAVEVETLAAMYIRARSVGTPHILDAREMARIVEMFRTYGTPDFPDKDLQRGGESWPGDV